jgi:hypothetical protein
MARFIVGAGGAQSIHSTALQKKSLHTVDALCLTFELTPIIHKTIEKMMCTDIWQIFVIYC